MNNLARNIFLLRNEKNRSQSEVCAQLGFPRNTWSNWENGISVPDIDKIIAIAHYFDIGLDDLIASDLNNNRPDKKGIPVEIITTVDSYVHEDQPSYERTAKPVKKQDGTAPDHSAVINALQGQIKAQEATILALQRTMQLLEEQLKSARHH